MNDQTKKLEACNLAKQMFTKSTILCNKIISFPKHNKHFTTPQKKQKNSRHFFPSHTSTYFPCGRADGIPDRVLVRNLVMLLV